MVTFWWRPSSCFIASSTFFCVLTWLKGLGLSLPHSSHSRGLYPYSLSIFQRSHFLIPLSLETRISAYELGGGTQTFTPEQVGSVNIQLLVYVQLIPLSLPGNHETKTFCVTPSGEYLLSAARVRGMQLPSTVQCWKGLKDPTILNFIPLVINVLQFLLGFWGTSCCHFLSLLWIL